jgi:hypothetical protein
MRVFSRWMPPLREDRYPPWTITDWIVFAFIMSLIVALLGLCVFSIVAARWAGGLVLLAFACLTAFGTWSANRAEHAVAEKRQGEDIGSFARALDRRSEPFDPWVVRAVWDAFSGYAGFPLRATDRLADFSIDPLELDHLVEEIAERSAHSLKNLHDGCEEVVTLGDLVIFVSSQSKRPTGA